MASSTRIPNAELTGIYAALIKRMSRKLIGQVPDSVTVMWHHPTVFKNLMGFGRKAEKWDRVDPNLSSLATMAAASAVGCSFCLDLGYFMAHNKNLDVAKAREVPRWRESDAFTSLERKVMTYAEAMSQTPLTVTDEMSAELLEELGAPALVELTARIAALNLGARSNIALGIRAQGFSTACGLQPLATPSTDIVSSA